MKCVIGSTNVKDFGRAVHSLAKIGEELYIEPSYSGVSFRTISSSRSAYFSYNFGSSFFTNYDGGVGDQTSASSEDTFRCKVAMKAVLNIFKGIHNLERTVQRCRLILKWEELKLVIQLTCHYGIVKTHNLSFIECDALQAVYDKDSCYNYVMSEPRVMVDALSSFHQHSLEEISFFFTSSNLVLKTHIEEPDPTKVVHTVVTLTFGEFEEYNIKRDCELTVCLKEIRALLTFLGSVGLSTRAYFSDPGSPIIFTFESKPLYEGTLVLATLVKKPDTNYPTHKSCQAAQSSTSLRKTTSSSTNDVPDSKRTFKVKTLPTTAAEMTVQNATPVVTNSEGETKRFSPQPTTHHHQENSQADDTFQTEVDHLSNNDNVTMDEDGESDHIPKSPPSKKGKFFLFSRCFESTFNPDSVPGHDIILAEDSDKDSDQEDL